MRASTKTSTQTVTTTTPTMQKGSTGNNVLELQKKLRAMGLYLGTLDGQFGSVTDAAVKAYQRMNGLVVDGIAGPKTLTALGMFSSTTQQVTSEVVAGIEEGSEAYYGFVSAIDDVKEKIADAYVEIFDNVKSSYEQQIGILERYSDKVNTALDNAETKGRLISTSYYTALSQVEKENINIMQQELAALEKSLQNALDSGQVQKYSSQWFEMDAEIYNVKKSIDEANHSLLEYEKTMRELGWEQFEFLQDRISKVVDEADFLVELLSNDKLFEDNGQFNREGRATVGLNADAYNVLMNQADRYAKEMKRVSKELAADPNNTDILKHYEELNKLQQDSILAAEKRKDAIKSLVEDGIKIELDNLKKLIDKYKDSLDSAKNLYDYQKRISSQVEDISKLEKTLSAYQNDLSEETRAKVQKLQVELDDKREELEETQYDRFKSDADKLLQNLYDEYSELVSHRTDDVTALMNDMIAQTNANAREINSTIINEASEVGYTLTDSMRNIWGQAGNIVAEYGTNFDAKWTTTNQVLSTIANNVASMVAASQKDVPSVSGAASAAAAPRKETEAANAKAAQAAQAQKSVASAPAQTQAPAKAQQAANTAQQQSGKGYQFTRDLNVGSQGADVLELQKALKAMNYYQGALDSYYGPLTKIAVTGYQIANGLYQDGFFGPKTREVMNQGWWIKGLKRFKSGGLVDKTGLAYLDGTSEKPELVLNAQDTKNFIALKEVLGELASPNALLSNIMLPNIASRMTTGTTIGDINIAIEHVENYDDFIRQFQADPKAQRLVQAMTTDQLSGRSSLSKYGVRL